MTDCIDIRRGDVVLVEAKVSSCTPDAVHLSFPEWENHWVPKDAVQRVIRREWQIGDVARIEGFTGSCAIIGLSEHWAWVQSSASPEPNSILRSRLYRAEPISPATEKQP